ncbi:TadE/TadG family type IV pilus assembly protein [Nocardia transvalensis]|uniref:TadE/TadG family type IV pilus assembly protein n=1 Tax=Nocardia transvalensis TaxID=37333 RepID=UPI001895298E|nr:hypothetical protein [Nocardia transvalensis]MBF6333622.1 hypothetical protein [Nocardia transvalensis]
MCTNPTPTRRPGRRIRAWARATRGRGSVVAFAILAPMAIILLLMGIEAALFYHARSLAVAAAEESLKQAASQYGNPAAGTAAGYAFIAASGPGVLQTPVVVVTRGPATATASITGKPPTLLWFWHPVVHVDLARPVERITTPGVPT